MATEHEEIHVDVSNGRHHYSRHLPPKKRWWDCLRCIDAPWLGEAILIGMQVWTDDELAQHAKVTTEQVRAWIASGLPTLPTNEGAVRISEAAFDEWAKCGHKVTARGGRKDETSEIAEFINELKNQSHGWKAILKSCRERWPNDLRVQNVEQLRGTYRRHAIRTRTQSDQSDCSIEVTQDRSI